MRNSFWISFVVALFISAVIVVNFDKDKFMGMVIESGLMTTKAEISELEFQGAFMDFVATYKKSYANSWEFEARYQIFKDNYQRIRDHNLNADMIGFDLRINQFGDLSQEEFKQKYLTLTPPRRGHHGRHQEKPFAPKKRFSDVSFFETKHNPLRDLPKEVDWRTTGKVQSVKDQGQCGSCWAFSAIGAMESAVAIKTGTLPDLSEQQLVDCSTTYGNQGCNGGFMDFGFKYAEDHPMCSEEQYPYNGVDQFCKDKDDSLCKGGVKVSDFVDVKQKSKADFYAALAEQPLSIGVCAEGLAWQFYWSGIVRWLCGACQDHGVLAVGYGHGGWKIFGETDYVIVKNSWGAGWGEKGYIRIASSEEQGDGTCGIYEMPSFPKV
uniref:Uncharacterized protein n=1 Tax=Euplotes harpa TaxID=151035 RepID=A0A7S3NAA7_9SPIT|mmetsp:Transcript_23901/g.27525  ORF Transcript_23901/g.27525 Transcript_23901/m.27525 type:complete len:380 (+) Transcript_23901:29-1168(+)